MDANDDWMTKATYLETLDAEIYFWLNESFYTGDPNDSAQIQNPDLQEALTLPDFPRAEPHRATTAEIIGHEAMLVAYYQSIVEKAYALDKDFREIRRYFRLGFELCNTPEKVCIDFWYETFSDIRRFTAWVAESGADEPFSDEEQHWQVDAQVADGFLYIRQIDPESDIAYNHVKTPFVPVQTSVRQAEARAKQIITALTRALGADVWTKFRYAGESVLFGTSHWLPKIRTPDKFCRDLKGLRIARAGTSDLEAILRLQYVAYRSEALIHGDFTIQPLTQTLDELRAEYQKSVFLKAVQDGVLCAENSVIVGSVRAYENEGTVYIGKLMVHPHCQGNGLGKRLLAAIEREFPNRRYELFTSAKSERNLRLYETAGYARFREETDAAGIGFVYLEKKRKNKGWAWYLFSSLFRKLRHEP